MTDPFPHQEISDLALHLWEISTEKDLGPDHFWFQAEAEMTFKSLHPHAAPVQVGGVSWFIRDEATDTALSEVWPTQEQAWADALRA